ncbi:hypothetical protein BDV30DRAFT_69817 [Aspergillus minisclerotigenes]|uniref:Uncharacterized protein n=1 Tax=Aspergillus minisclerotigenes TaxID=656917 RepID=A0A5N6IL17_9EURO|nr:hypothetical protein BDV30DRAFT_69817 [Aspergillus minisclerotigenes]
MHSYSSYFSPACLLLVLVEVNALYLYRTMLCNNHFIVHAASSRATRLYRI